MRHRFLMCPATHYRVEYSINAWMEGNRDRVQPETAQREWDALYALISEHATIELIDPVPELPDLVFAGGAALVLGKRAVLSRFAHEERRPEEAVWRKWLHENGFEIIEVPDDIAFEGASDCALSPDGGPLWMGYGFRTQLEAGDFLARTFDCEVVPLHLVERRFFDLTACFGMLEGGYLLYYPPAFDERSLREIERRIPPRNRYAVSERDALKLCCSALESDGCVIVSQASAELARVLGAWGKKLVTTGLGEFMLGGGAARGMALRLDEPAPKRRSSGHTPPLVSATVHFRGPLLEPGLLEELFHAVSSKGGTHEVAHMNPGRKGKEPATLELRVEAPSTATMETILSELIKRGGRTDFEVARPATLLPAEMDGVAPEGFYGTTIFATEVFFDGRWHRLRKQRMDGVIVADRSAGHATCVLIRDLKKGDLVAVGHEGIRTIIARQPEEEGEDFKFMSSTASTERRVETAVESIAWEMFRIRSRGGRIAVVAGPVVIHTGGGPYLENLIREGYVSALLGGNAIAVHDIENSMYGTSLGVNLKRGAPVRGGHMHHITTINRIRRCGSIAAAVEQGVVTSGIFHTLVKTGVPFSLAGSIRDDGPLPDTEMDLVQAQTDYARLIEGADMILMLSSMLHSIGVGNMTPAGVKLVCVDINVSVATKLADRGSMDSTPVITDVGLFLNLLWRRLEEMGKDATSRVV